MPIDKFRVLEEFLNLNVEIQIYGEKDEDHPPSVTKPLKKLALCPDKTHLRLYFDDFYFIAVPKESNFVSALGHTVVIHDETANLYYKIKKAT
jgi:hypothetical protein